MYFVYLKVLSDNNSALLRSNNGGMALSRRQTISWFIGDPVHECINNLIGLNVLKSSKRFFWTVCGCLHNHTCEISSLHVVVYYLMLYRLFVFRKHKVNLHLISSCDAGIVHEVKLIISPYGRQDHVCTIQSVPVSSVDDRMTWRKRPILFPFYKHGIALIPAWICSHTDYEVWGEIAYPFLNFNGCTVEV